MQQKLEKLQLRVKIFFSARTVPSSPLLTSLTKKNVFSLFLPKYTNLILEEEKSFLMLLLSFNHRVFNTIFKPLQDLYFQKENSILHFILILLDITTISQVMVTGYYQSI